MSKHKQRKATVNRSVIFQWSLQEERVKKVFFKEKVDLFIRFAEQVDIIVNKFRSGLSNPFINNKRQ